MKNELMEKMLSEKIVAIVRGVAKEKMENLFTALYNGGVRFVEITFDATEKIPPEETARTIGELAKKFEGRISVGAGTVITARQAELACKAGAGYIISPTVEPEVIRYCNEHDMISIPGAMTPTEVLSAYRLGADIVKLFPSDSLGLAYIKAISAPLSQVPMMAVGGVTEANITDFLKVVKGVGIGSSMIRKDLIAADNWAALTEHVKKYTDAARSV